MTSMPIGVDLAKSVFEVAANSALRIWKVMVATVVRGEWAGGRARSGGVPSERAKLPADGASPAGHSVIRCPTGPGRPLSWRTSRISATGKSPR